MLWTSNGCHPIISMLQEHVLLADILLWLEIEAYLSHSTLMGKFTAGTGHKYFAIAKLMVSPHEINWVIAYVWAPKSFVN